MDARSAEDAAATTALTGDQARAAFFKAADDQLREGGIMHSELIVARMKGSLTNANLIDLMRAWAQSREYPLNSLTYGQFGGFALMLLGPMLGFASLGVFSAWSYKGRGAGPVVGAIFAIASIAMVYYGWTFFRNARMRRRECVERANTICPECHEPVSTATGACPCGYLDKNARSDVAPGTYQKALEIETAGGKRSFATEDEVRAAILAGTLSRSMQVSQKAEPVTTTDTQSPDPQVPQIRASVGDFAGSSFALRSLYEPVWAHSIRGLWVGVVVGICFWLAQLAWTMFYIVDNPVIGGVIIVYLLLIVRLVLPANTNWVLSRIIWGTVPTIIVILSVNYGIGTVFVNIGRGLVMQFGAIVAGSLFGGLLGIMVGTLVGVARKNKIETAPDATDEGRGPIKKGLLIPALLFAVLVTLYVIVYIPWMTGVIERAT
jgi:hypothetical protein